MSIQSHCGSLKVVNYAVNYGVDMWKILTVVSLIHANGSLPETADVSAAENYKERDTYHRSSLQPSLFRF